MSHLEGLRGAEHSGESGGARAERSQEEEAGERGIVQELASWAARVTYAWMLEKTRLKRRDCAQLALACREQAGPGCAYLLCLQRR